MRKLDGTFKKSLLYGKGFDDTDYQKERRTYSNGKSKVIWHCETYSRWKNMLKRCYGSIERPYEDVSVCDEWLYFSNYKNWLENQKLPDVPWDVDKDLLDGRSRTYSPETCIIIPKNLNLYLFTSIDKGLVGSSYEPDRKKYRGYCKQFGGKRLNFGRFDTEYEAHRMWQIEKAKQLRVAMDWYSNQSYAVESAVSSLNKIIENVERDILKGVPTRRLYT